MRCALCSSCEPRLDNHGRPTGGPHRRRVRAGRAPVLGRHVGRPERRLRTITRPKALLLGGAILAALVVVLALTGTLTPELLNSLVGAFTEIGKETTPRC